MVVFRASLPAVRGAGYDARRSATPRRGSAGRLACAVLLALALPLAAHAQDEAEPPPRLLDLPAFDRITLNVASGGETVDVQPLELPGGRVPQPLPTAGSLTVYRLSQPSVAYEVSWSAIAKIERYPELLLEEARRLTAAGAWSDAFAYLTLLHKFYPEQPGLGEASQEYLWRDAGATFSAGKPADALPVLMALYELNPDYPRLPNAVQVIADNLIGRLLKEDKYAAARSTLDALERSFPKLTLTNVTKWQQRFADDARAQLDAARAALERRDYAAARAAAQRAEAIVPNAAGAKELLAAIQRAAPEMRVGVTSLLAPGWRGGLPTWERARVAPLVLPRLASLADFGAEGGEYRSRWASFTTREDGLQTTIALEPAALAAGVTPDFVALRLLERARPGHPNFDPDFAGLLAGVEIAEGRTVVVRWRQPHIIPVALLDVPLVAEVTTGDLPEASASSSRESPLAFVPEPVRDAATERVSAVRYQRGGPRDAAEAGPVTLVERLFADDEAALAALAQGEIDVLDHVPPWQLAAARGLPGVRVGAYRLPTVHVLALNFERPLIQQREFRRALCYAIDSAGIVRDMLLAGQELPGFQPLSGPFAAGVSLGDPVGYAYNAALAPRTYEPRLASVLASVARATVAKLAAASSPATPPADGADATEGGTEGGAADAGANAKTADEKPAPPTPLKLAHATDPVARLACQTIKLQLDGAGIPVELVEITADNASAALECDMAYVELAVWEPIVDARQLLGPSGAAGSSTAFMNLSLDELSRSQNWNEARNRLKEIHRIARADLPVIPLWQTVNHFAVREWLQGVGDQPVTLYQDLPSWRKRFDDGP